MDTTPQSPELIALAAEVTPAEQQDIARVAGVTTEHPAFNHFLGMARYYGLSALLGEIWLIDTDVFDAETGSWATEKRPAVGRDGFFKIARRDENVIVPPRFAVVCANDTFETEDDGREIKINHKVSLARANASTAGQAEKLEAEVRGEILGSWAKLFYRDDTPSVYYWASLAEHGKKRSVAEDGAEAGEEEWIGAWTYTQGLICKCSQSYVTRIGASITGLVPVDEMRSQDAAAAAIEGAGGVTTRRSTRPAIGDTDAIVRALEIPDDLKMDLAGALAEVNRLSPFSWATAKVSIVLAGADEEQASKVLDEIKGEIEKLSAGSVGA